MEFPGYTQMSRLQRFVSPFLAPRKVPLCCVCWYWVFSSRRLFVFNAFRYLCVRQPTSGLQCNLCCASSLSGNISFSYGVEVAVLCCLYGVCCSAYWQLALLRLAAGLASGGVHPLAYSWVGDWFRPSLRSCASALVLGAAGFGTFCGQCLAALLGALDWRWVFLILAAPLLFMAQFYYIANGPLTATSSSHCTPHCVEAGEGGAYECRGLDLNSLKAMARSKTNLLMLVQVRHMKYEIPKH